MSCTSYRGIVLLQTIFGVWMRGHTKQVVGGLKRLSSEWSVPIQRFGLPTTSMSPSRQATELE